MPKRIYKYELKVEDEQVVKVPMNSRFITIQNQFGRIQMWLMVDPFEFEEEIKIRCFGTGHDIPVDESNLLYMGTVQDMQMVWHFFRDPT